jgi:MFS transporter, DHA1 family, 2-module integral membrane pump EmrD
MLFFIVGRQMGILSRSEIKTMLIIMSVGVGALMGVDIHLASLPYIMVYMHTDKLHMQQSISFYLLGLGLSLLFYGPLSDKFGRKPIIVFGMTLAGVASFGGALTQHITLFLVMRFIQGLGAGACAGLSRTMSADVLQGEERARLGSYFSLGINLSPLLAPLLGGVLQSHFGWQANFIFLGSYFLCAMLVFLLFCPETNKHIEPRRRVWSRLLPTYGSILKNPLFVVATAITGVSMSAITVYSTTSAFIFKAHYHVSPEQFGLLTLVVAMGAVLGKLIKPALTQRIGMEKSVLVGVGLIGLGGLGLLVFAGLGKLSLPFVIGGIFVTFLGCPFVQSTTMYYALGPFHDKRGSAGALFGSAQMLFKFTCSVLVSLFVSDSVVLLGVSFVILSVLGVLLFPRLRGASMV